MGTKVIKKHWCDWCDRDIPDRTGTTPYSGLFTYTENGPDNWTKEELCTKCASALKALRSIQRDLSGTIPTTSKGDN